MVRGKKLGGTATAVAEAPATAVVMAGAAQARATVSRAREEPTHVVEAVTAAPDATVPAGTTATGIIAEGTVTATMSLTGTRRGWWPR